MEKERLKSNSRGKAKKRSVFILDMLISFCPESGHFFPLFLPMAIPASSRITVLGQQAARWVVGLRFNVEAKILYKLLDHLASVYYNCALGSESKETRRTFKYRSRTMHTGAPSLHLFLQNLRTSGAFSSQGWHLHIMLGELLVLPDVEHRKKRYVNILASFSLKSCLPS